MSAREIPAGAKTKRVSEALPFETGQIQLPDRQVSFAVFRSRKRRRTIAFRLDAKVGLKVMAPTRVSLAEIHRLLQRRMPWIRQKLQDQRMSHGPEPIDAGSRVNYLGHACAITLDYPGGKTRDCRLLPGRFVITLPDADLTDADRQHEITLALTLWFKKRARTLFKKRTDIWAERLGLDYRDVLVTSPTRLWGSCNARNVIRLNWHLMLAPIALLDYVVAHELCHVAHKNHGPRFWRLLESVMPDYKARRKQLRLIGPALTL